jgi:hypothetical protein
MSTEQASKLEFLEWLATVNDKKTILEFSKWKEEHQRISLDLYNKDLDEADNEIDTWEYYTQQELEAQAKSW